jgi:hypothetical protein
VHNFLVRTGILARFDTACYQVGGCADIIDAVAQRIDARQFNPGFPQLFPRFVQHAIWRYCAQSGLEPQVAAIGKDQDELPVATGLPRTWDEIAPGHLVIAQEALDYGWWEAVVIGRDGDMFTLRFRDYPKLPKFVRHRNAIALMSPPAE